MQALGYRPSSPTNKPTFGRVATEEERQFIRAKLTESGVNTDKVDPQLIRVQCFDTWQNQLAGYTVRLKKDWKEVAEVGNAVSQKEWTDAQPWAAILYTFGNEKAAARHLQKVKKAKEILKKLYQQLGQPLAYDTVNFLMTPTKVMSITGRKQTLPNEDNLNPDSK